MITTGAKFWAAVGAVALVATFAYLLITDGEKLGTYVLIGTVLAAVAVTSVLVSTRDGELAVASHTDPAPPAGWARPPAVPWPALGALGGALLLVGLATGVLFVAIGIGVLVVTLIEWMVQGWAERATGDQVANRELRNGMMFPFEIPLAAAIAVAFIVLLFSRVLLALPKSGSVVIAIVLAAAVLLLALLLSASPRLSSSVLAGVLVLGALGLLGGGIAGAVVGERDIEAHEEEGPEAEVIRESGVDIGDRTEIGPVDLFNNAPSAGDEEH